MGIQYSEEIVCLIMIWLCVIIGVCAVLASAQNKASYYPYVPSYEPYPQLSYQRQPYSNQPVYQPQLPVYYQPASSYTLLVGPLEVVALLVGILEEMVILVGSLEEMVILVGSLE